MAQRGTLALAILVFSVAVTSVQASTIPLPTASLLAPLGPPLEGGPLRIDADVPLLDWARPQILILVLDPTLESTVLQSLARLQVEHRFFDQLHMVAILADEPTLAAIQTIPGVVSVHANERMKALLDRSTAYVGARVVWNTYGLSGKGVTILVMDSGIDGTHPDLPYGSKVIENVVPKRQASGLVGGSKEGVVSSDPDGHGTHVAAIAAGSGKHEGKFRGIAYNARLVGYQAGLIDEAGEVTFESVTVLEGFNWALANRAKHGITVVSNSWGANGEFDPRSPVNLATFNLYKAGILVVFAAGNEGDRGEHTLNKYSVAPWVLSVTAGDYLNNIPAFSSSGTDPALSGKAYDHPDLVAPGVGITSARAGPYEERPLGRLYGQKSGSSMSAPHVAGVVALLLEANPRLSPDDLMDILTATATPLPDYEVWEGGAGYVNALKAYQLALREPGHRAEFLSGKVKYGGPASGDPEYARDAVSVGYLKGAAYRLRSPDQSIGSFTLMLVSTPHGLTFMIGGGVLGLAAFGLPRKPSIAQPAVTRLATPTRT